MALTAGVNYKARPGSIQSFKVKSGVTIYNGAVVMINETSSPGLLDNWADASTATKIVLAGIARVHAEDLDKVVGDGTKEVEVDISGHILEDVAVAGADVVGDVLDLVYASDENTFTLTVTAGKNPIGVLARQGPVSGRGDVKLFSMTESKLASEAELGL